MKRSIARGRTLVAAALVTALATAANGMATIVEEAGLVIAAVREMVRDAIAIVVSRLIDYAVEELFSLVKRINGDGVSVLLVEQNVVQSLEVADRAYILADGKFVMSGGNPTLYDGTAGNTSGRQLTFFLADDTIIVDSENGSRILTKHRVDNQAN